MSNRSQKTAICLFAKAVHPGQVKTRLAQSIGLGPATSLAKAFFADTWAKAATLSWARLVLAANEPAPKGLEVGANATCWLQGDGDLGQRLERILGRALGEHETALAVGSDAPHLPLRALRAARQALYNADAVMGPCRDGGFYLLGLRRCPPRLLADLPWSQTNTFTATHQRLEAQGMRVTILEPWYDVDTREDLQHLIAALKNDAEAAPATAAAIRTLGL